jgi:hypothetical protein
MLPLTLPPPLPACVDLVDGWVDSDGDSCDEYRAHAGDPGGPWCGPRRPPSWAPVSAYAVDGYDADAVCCGCRDQPAAPPPLPLGPASRRPARITAQTADRVDAALAYAEQLIGTPYGWWTGGASPLRAPAWSEQGPPPLVAEVREATCFCAGVTNLMRREVGLEVPCWPGQGCGGTGAYGEFFSRVLYPFNISEAYPRGTLLGRYYRDVSDQGHVAVLASPNDPEGSGVVLQSFANEHLGSAPVVNDDYRLQSSHAGYYYEYAVLPQDWLG